MNKHKETMIKVDVSIHPKQRKHATTERRKRHHARNKAVRSELYQAHAGCNNWQRDVSGWHTALFALSNGNAS